MAHQTGTPALRSLTVSPMGWPSAPLSRRHWLPHPPGSGDGPGDSGPDAPPGTPPASPACPVRGLSPARSVCHRLDHLHFVCVLRQMFRHLCCPAVPRPGSRSPCGLCLWAAVPCCHHRASAPGASIRLLTWLPRHRRRRHRLRGPIVSASPSRLSLSQAPRGPVDVRLHAAGPTARGGGWRGHGPQEGEVRASGNVPKTRRCLQFFFLAHLLCR